MARWRPMCPADLADAEALGSMFHVHHPEGPGIAPERLRLAPQWCFVLELDSGFAGYCVAHPWCGPLPPGLDTLIGQIPEASDVLHLHDIVLVEGARRGGHAATMLRGLGDRAALSGLRRITLIAVGDAGPYWKKQGFQPDLEPERIAFVTRSYGDDAAPMSLAIAAA